MARAIGDEHAKIGLVTLSVATNLPSGIIKALGLGAIHRGPRPINEMLEGTFIRGGLVTSAVPDSEE